MARSKRKERIPGTSVLVPDILTGRGFSAEWREGYGDYRQGLDICGRKQCGGPVQW